MSLPDLPIPSTDRTDEMVRLHEANLAEGRLDFARLFGRSGHETELEIGVGKGRFMMLAATAQPDTNFLGLEYASRFLSKAIDRIAKRGLTNVRLVHTEALGFMRERIDDQSIAAVHVYFPDPWPKKRHHKRRMFRDEVLIEFARIMKPGALLRGVTDHADYAEVIEEVVSGHPTFSRLETSPTTWQLPGMGDYMERGVTNFEIKYREEGRSIHRFAWARSDVPHTAIPTDTT